MSFKHVIFTGGYESGLTSFYIQNGAFHKIEERRGDGRSSIVEQIRVIGNTWLKAQGIDRTIFPDKMKHTKYSWTRLMGRLQLDGDIFKQLKTEFMAERKKRQFFRKKPIAMNQPMITILNQLHLPNEIKEIVKHSIDEYIKQCYIQLKNRDIEPDKEKAALVGIIKGYNRSNPELQGLFYDYKIRDSRINVLQQTIQFLSGNGKDKYGPIDDVLEVQRMFGVEKETLIKRYSSEIDKYKMEKSDLYKQQEKVLKDIYPKIKKEEIWKIVTNITDIILEYGDIEGKLWNETKEFFE